LSNYIREYREMSKLISGKEALIALANGEEVQIKCVKDDEWYDSTQWTVGELLRWQGEFRLKPRTITINGIELNQCYSVAIDYTRNEVKVEFKNRNDAEALHDVVSKLYGFK